MGYNSGYLSPEHNNIMSIFSDTEYMCLEYQSKAWYGARICITCAEHVEASASLYQRDDS